MRKLSLLLLVWLFAVGAAVAAQQEWFVSKLGSNTLCDGTSPNPYDAGFPGAPCAFATISFAISDAAPVAPRTKKFTCAGDGDDVTVGAGLFSEAPVMPNVCVCPSAANNCVISGAGRTGSTGTGTTISGGPTANASFSIGSSNFTAPNQYITIQDFEIKGANHWALACASASGQRLCADITMQRLNFNGFQDMFPVKDAARQSCLDGAVSFCESSSGATLGKDNNVLTDFWIDGDVGDAWTSPTGGNCWSGTGYTFCGARTNAIYMNTQNSRVSNGVIEDMEGYIARLAGNGIIEDISAKNMSCGADDGCIQLYNSPRMIVRRLLCDHCIPSDGGGSPGTHEALGVIQMRRTSSTNTKPSAHIYNNTIIAHPMTCSSNPCEHNTVSNDYYNSMAIGTRAEAGAVTTYGNFELVHNIIAGFKMVGTFQPTSKYSAAFYIGATIALGDCPDPLLFSGNIYYDNAVPIKYNSAVQEAACPGTRMAGDSRIVQADPMLDSSRAPMVGSPACSSGGNYHKPWTTADGFLTDPVDVPDLWAGAEQGACTATTPDCGNGVKEGFEDCDGAAFGGETCQSLGFDSGTLACTADCKYDTVTPGCVFPTAAVVQSVTGMSNNNNTGLSLTLPGAVTDGNLIVVAVSRRSGTSTLTKMSCLATPCGITWLPVAADAFSNNEALFCRYGIAGAATQRDLVMEATNAGSWAGVMAEFHGAKAVSPLDRGVGSDLGIVGLATNPVTGTPLSKCSANSDCNSNSCLAGVCQPDVLTQSKNMLISCLGQANGDPTYSNPQGGWAIAGQKFTGRTANGDAGNGTAVAMLWKAVDSKASDAVVVDISLQNNTANIIGAFKQPSIIAGNTAFCADYILETGETCDFEEFNGATCANLGATGGTLRCNNLCGYDLNGCIGSVADCSSGGQNGVETDIDCGGTVCPRCPTGNAVPCTVNGDCTPPTQLAALCTAGRCAGMQCAAASDCSSLRCDAGAPARCGSCSDLIKNNTESAVDCGGSTGAGTSTCAPCGAGLACLINGDCASNSCGGITANICDATVVSSCANFRKDPLETDIDCGGAAAGSGCEACNAPQNCLIASDCLSLRCEGTPGNKHCATCYDTAQSGVETATDCGGAATPPVQDCPRCPNGRSCLDDTDCQSQNCSFLNCQPLSTGANCNNGSLDVPETDVDCGGGTCLDCGAGLACNNSNANCLSDRCESNVCRTCTDRLKTGSESDIDCGGGTATRCQQCVAGQTCNTAADCDLGRCEVSASSTALLCRSCSDGVKTGIETGTDCGGSCAKCGAGSGCNSNDDCAAPLTCTNRVCSAQAVLPTGASRFISEWNVRPDGHDTNCSGTRNTAWSGDGRGGKCAFKTLDRAARAARCGDTIRVRPGTHITAGLTRTTDCPACAGGFYSYTSMGLIEDKACSNKAVLTIRGDLDPNGAYLSILDGQNALNQAFAIEDSSYVTVQDINVRNFLSSDPNGIESSVGLGVISVADSRNITLRHNRMTSLQAGAYDFFSEDSLGLQLLKNYWMSSAQYIVAFGNLGGDVSTNTVVRENAIISANRMAGWPAASRLMLLASNLADVTLRSNYFGVTSDYSAVSGDQVGALLLNTVRALIHGNVFNDLQVTAGSAYLYFLSGNSACSVDCSARSTVTHNVFYKATANSTTSFVRSLSILVGQAIGGSQFFNNSFSVAAAAADANDTAFALLGDGDDLSGIQDARVDYNFYSNVAKPMVATVANVGCPTALCASTSTLDQHPSTNDQHNSSSSGLTLAGNAPWPFFGISSTATQRNTGSNTYCFVVPSDALCDIAPFEYGGGLTTTGGIPPWNGQSVVIPTVAGVN